MADNATETLGSRITRLLRERNWSQSELARRSGVERSQLSRLISGKRSPKPDELAWIAGALETSAEQLLEGVVVAGNLRTTAHLLTERAKRFLQLQRELDIANALNTAIDEDRVRERAAWCDERRGLLEELSTLRNELQGLYEEHSRLQVALRSARAHIRTSSIKGRRLMAHVQQLEADKASHASDKALTALLAGIGGALLTSS